MECMYFGTFTSLVHIDLFSLSMLKVPTVGHAECTGPHTCSFQTKPLFIILIFHISTYWEVKDINSIFFFLFSGGVGKLLSCTPDREI